MAKAEAQLRVKIAVTANALLSERALKRAESIADLVPIEVEGLRASGMRYPQVEGLWVRFDTRVEAGLFDCFPSLRFVATSTTGTTHIDLSECRRRSIEVIALDPKALRSKGVTSTAEHTWTLILAAQTRLIEQVLHTQNGTWNSFSFVRARQLSSQTIGILGLGRVGTMVARYAKAFGMNVIAVDSSFLRRLRGRLAGIKILKHPGQLFERASIVSLHASIGNQPVPIVGLDEYARGNGVVLVNTARAEIINEAEIAVAIRKGWLASYFCDVGAFESQGQNFHESELFGLQQSSAVRATPHTAGLALDAIERAELVSIRQVAMHLKRTRLQFPRH